MPDGVIPTRTVQGKFLLPDKSPAQGTITFTPEYTGLNRNSQGNEIYLAKPVIASLDTTGSFSVDLVIGNDDDGSVTGWTYLVTLAVSGFSQSYSIQLFAASPNPTDLADIIPSGTFAGVIPAYYTLAIGTVTTNTSGTASATITGTFPNQTLNLALPQGPTGTTGTIDSLPIQNLVTNPSAEVATTPWIAATGAGSLTRNTTLGFSGTSSFQWTATASGTSEILSGNSLTQYHPVTPGTTYTASVYHNPGALTGKTGRVGIQYFNSAGTVVQTTAGTAITLTASAFTRVTFTAAAPATAVYARLLVTITNAVSGEVYYADAAQLEVGSTATAYFDGDTFAGLNGSRWASTPHSSISSRGRHFYASDFYDFDDYFGELITMGYF